MLILNSNKFNKFVIHLQFW